MIENKEEVGCCRAISALCGSGEPPDAVTEKKRDSEDPQGSASLSVP